MYIAGIVFEILFLLERKKKEKKKLIKKRIDLILKIF